MAAKRDSTAVIEVFRRNFLTYLSYRNWIIFLMLKHVKMPEKVSSLFNCMYVNSNFHIFIISKLPFIVLERRTDVATTSWRCFTCQQRASFFYAPIITLTTQTYGSAANRNQNIEKVIHCEFLCIFWVQRKW